MIYGQKWHWLWHKKTNLIITIVNLWSDRFTIIEKIGAWQEMADGAIDIQGVPKQADKSKVLKLKQNWHLLDCPSWSQDLAIWSFMSRFTKISLKHQVWGTYIFSYTLYVYSINPISLPPALCYIFMMGLIKSLNKHFSFPKFPFLSAQRLQDNYVKHYANCKHKLKHKLNKHFKITSIFILQ